MCTQRLRPNLASVVGTCLWPHSPATLRPCRGVFGDVSPSGSALPGAMLGAAAGAASAGSVVGGSEIGLDDPAQVGDLRGFVGAFGSLRAARGGVDLTKSASAELPNAVCAPRGTYYVVLWYNFEDVSDGGDLRPKWPYYF